MSRSLQFIKTDTGKKIGNLSRPRTATDTETLIKVFPTEESLGPYGFTGEFCIIFLKQLILILHNRWKKQLKWKEQIHFTGTTVG